MPDPSITRQELAGLFLFEEFSPEQLDWLIARGEVVTHPAGSTLHAAKDRAAWLYVLLEGRVQMRRDIAGEEVVVNETDQVGAYMGAVRSYVAGGEGMYESTVVTVTPARLFRLSSEDFAELMRRWFPMALHLLDGLYIGISRTQSRLREREKLLALGSLSAKLTHELNNPAAAASRAAGQLRQRVGQLRHKLQLLAEGRVDPAIMATLVHLGEEAVERAAKAPRLSALKESEAEEQLSDWLEDRDIVGAWVLAPVFVAAGLDVAWLEEVAGALAPIDPGHGLSWLAGTIEIEMLLDEVESATGRITTLVAAAKQYSHVDRAPTEAMDLTEGLESTVTLMGHKLTGIEVQRDYDPDLGQVVIRPAELNQVWTNLLDNAADALGGSGTITLRSSRDGEMACVSVTDDGPGIPDDVLPQIFEAFFTTKPSGGGTGVGLEISKRIVEQVHGGTLSVDTGPAGTTFTVCLPVAGAADAR